MNDSPAPPLIVVMGVAGSGKSSAGRALALALHLPFLEGDDLHPPRNVARMTSGQPLDDEDRREWLAVIAARIEAARGTTGIVAACSALKRRYRDVLRAGGPVLFVHLFGSRTLMKTRLAARRGHFMPASLIDSQFDALEPPEADEWAVTLAADGAIAEIVAAAAKALALPPPGWPRAPADG